MVGRIARRMHPCVANQAAETLLSECKFLLGLEKELEQALGKDLVYHNPMHENPRGNYFSFRTRLDQHSHPFYAICSKLMSHCSLLANPYRRP